MPAQPAIESATPRRKRVAKACDTCRAMKSRCDGKRPICGRCDGYGYKCVYSNSGRKRRGPDMDDDGSSAPHENVNTSLLPASKVNEMKELLIEYQALLRDIAPKVVALDSDGTTKTIQSLNCRAGVVLEGLKPYSGHIQVVIQPKIVHSPSNTPRTRHEHSPRYLGDVSDVKFFNLVNRVLATSPEQVEGEDGCMDSYEHDEDQDTGSGSDAVPTNGLTVNFPRPEVADAYMDIYFSTIHVAYPFIPKRSFVKSYSKLRESKDSDGIDRCRLATLFIVFAIGAYYLSFPGKTDSLHEYYYSCAVSLCNSDAHERSIEQVTFLLARCFYLLTVCKTDKCWTTLGLAVRHAQTIGLHVEHEESRVPSKQSDLVAERRRRLWYSLYVLDRLLSLQLGRPTAVHDEDCDISLPSRMDDADIDWEDEGVVPGPSGGTSAGDYFLEVIKLSGLIGRTLRSLYSPQKATEPAERLALTASLDNRLLGWKRNLPRALRFDLGHAFEKSTTFRRQRNMLAIKFHHLRALIHRPYLFLPRSHTTEQGTAAAFPSEGPRCAQYERICVAEARETAHLLHNVADEKDLVHDFPWWQMISCLICASSILVVASVFGRRPAAGPAAAAAWEFDADVLDDDAETCLKAFEALSLLSDGARLGRDMMARLKQRGQAWSNSDAQSKENFQEHLMPMGEQSDRQHQRPEEQLALQETEEPLPRPFLPQNDSQAVILGPDLLSMPCPGEFQLQEEWPPEIADSMVWSAQFVNPMDDGGVGQDFT